MESCKPRVGVIFTLLELYRKAHPDRPAALGKLWRNVMTDLLSSQAELHFAMVAHNAEEVTAAVQSCSDAECDLLILLPMAYAASGASRDALTRTKLPLLLVSTARDATLPYDMSGDHIMANHAMHGVQDLANVLARAGRRFVMVAGHHADPGFRARIARCVRASAGARVLRRGIVGRIGHPFDGMLDFSYDLKTLADAPLLAGGFKTIEIPPAELSSAARDADHTRVTEVVAWATDSFEVDPALTPHELATSARYALALENVVASRNLDAVTMNFLAVAQVGAETMPFLGASRLMSRGVGYAGEGDTLTAALVAAVAGIAGEATFTEMFCPDYGRAEILLSHMGECNFALANPSVPVRLVAKEFAYGDCERPAVTVFQLRPATVTLASITEWPGEGLRLVAAQAEVLDAPQHENLSSPYSRITLGRPLSGFLEDYSRAGGTHHLALAYGDLREEFGLLAGLCGIGFQSV